MQNEILTPRDLFDNVDYYRNMRMSFNRNGGGNVWRYKQTRNIIHIQSNMVAQKYRNGTAVGQQFRLFSIKLDIVRRLDCELDWKTAVFILPSTLLHFGTETLAGSTNLRLAFPL